MMAITRGFGMTLDIERGLMRQWVIGRDGVKRWADNNRPVDEQAPHEILQAAIDTANVYASCPHEDLRLVTLRMDEPPLRDWSRHAAIRRCRAICVYAV
jgi:hypothetical protein